MYNYFIDIDNKIVLQSIDIFFITKMNLTAKFQIVSTPSIAFSHFQLINQPTHEMSSYDFWIGLYRLEINTITDGGETSHKSFRP